MHVTCVRATVGNVKLMIRDRPEGSSDVQTYDR